MVLTPRFNTPFALTSGQKTDATLNDLIRLFDAMTHPLILDKDLTAPPGGESTGDAYIVGASATGDWSGKDDDIAVYWYGTWHFLTPWNGFTVWVDDESVAYTWGTSSWDVDHFFVDGDNNTFIGSGNAATGTMVTGTSLIVGTGNTVEDTDSTLIFGVSNTHTTPSSFGGMEDNVIIGVSNTFEDLVTGAVCVGANNSLIAGYSLTQPITDTTVIGSGNTVNYQASDSVIIGANNTLNTGASRNYVFGEGNSIGTVTRFCTLIGNNNFAPTDPNGRASIGIGTSNRFITTDTYGSGYPSPYTRNIVIGQYGYNYGSYSIVFNPGGDVADSPPRLALQGCGSSAYARKMTFSIETSWEDNTNATTRSAAEFSVWNVNTRAAFLKARHLGSGVTDVNFPTGNVGIGVAAPGEALDVDGNIEATGWIRSTSATTPIGYAAGAGGTVTQLTSRTTGVTINTATGQITLVSAAGSATPATFTVTNSAVAATDVIILNQSSGTDKYELRVTAVSAGSFDITFNTLGGTTTEQPVINFAVIKGVAS